MKKSPEELDVDIRFLLANERTLLAWIRTSLALIAGGLAFTQLGTPTLVKNIFGITFIAIGAMMSVFGYIRHQDADKAIRAGRLPEHRMSPKLQVITVVILAVVLIGVKLTLV